jgi:hypothetical protein
VAGLIVIAHQRHAAAAPVEPSPQAAQSGAKSGWVAGRSSIVLRD